MKRIAPLTALRFFAAYSIVFYHAGAWKVFGVPFVHSLVSGVSFFFVLSGFILTYVYRDMRVSDLPKFYGNRIARLWPVHVATLLAVLLLFPENRDVLGTELGRLALFANVFLVQAAIPAHPIAISFNGVSWSISAEMFFYAAFPLLVIPRRWWVFCIICPVVSVFALFLLDAFGFRSASAFGWRYYISMLVYTGPIVRISEFALGVAVAHCFLSTGQKSQPNFWLGTTLEIGSVLLIVLVIVFDEPISRFIGNRVPFVFSYWFQNSGYAPVFAFAIYVFASSSGLLSRALSWRPMLFLGEASFSAYMVHQTIFRVIVGAGWPQEYDAKLMFIVAVLATVATSCALYLIVERPMRVKMIDAFARLSAVPRTPHRGPSRNTA